MLQTYLISFVVADDDN